MHPCWNGEEQQTEFSSLKNCLSRGFSYFVQTVGDTHVTVEAEFSSINESQEPRQGMSQKYFGRMCKI